MTDGSQSLLTAAQSLADSPPATVPALRALMVAIARGEASVTVGAKALAALERILDLQETSALLSITVLAEVLEVNPSTLTRLAHSLGYTGFRAFQRVLLSAATAAPGAFYTHHASSALEGGGSTVRAQASKLCRENQTNIDRFIENLDIVAFELAVERIMLAPRVAVYGIRQFHAVASFLVYGLRMIRSDVTLIDGNSLGIAEGLALLSRGDVLISTSCAPYSAQVVEVAEIALRIGLQTVTITDRASSPLVRSSQSALLVPHESSFLSNSLGAFIVAAECLINGCAAARPEQARAALQVRDEMIERLGIEM